MVHLNPSTFWPLADVKPIKNYLAHAMHWHLIVLRVGPNQGTLTQEEDPVQLTSFLR